MFGADNNYLKELFIVYIVVFSFNFFFSFLLYGITLLGLLYELLTAAFLTLLFTIFGYHFKKLVFISGTCLSLYTIFTFYNLFNLLFIEGISISLVSFIIVSIEWFLVGLATKHIKINVFNR